MALDGHRLHYIDEGHGPLLLFLHANPLWSFQYRRLIQVLRRRFRCVALDYPGFGLSEARADFTHTLQGDSALVEAFIRMLDLKDVILVAHDSSVSIGLGVVARQPSWFRALVISNGFAWPIQEDPGISRFIGIVASRPVGWLIVRFNVLARYTIANLKLSPAERRAYLQPFADRRRRRHQHDLFRSILASRDYLADLKRRLGELRDLPVLLAFADNDPTYKAGWLQRYEHLFPQHHSVRIAGAHHFPQEYNPDAMSAAIQDWWAGQQPGE